MNIDIVTKDDLERFKKELMEEHYVKATDIH